MTVWLPLLVLISAGAPEADWWYVIMSGEVGDQSAHYTDRSSIRRNGSQVFVSEARERESADSLGIRSSRTEVEYDCQARTGRIVRGVFFAADGSVLTREEGTDDPIAAEAGSVAEAMLRFACGEEEGLEQLGDLAIREQALLLFRDREEYLRQNPNAD